MVRLSTSHWPHSGLSHSGTTRFALGRRSCLALAIATVTGGAASERDISAAGRRLIGVIDAMDVERLWQAGYPID